MDEHDDKYNVWGCLLEEMNRMDEEMAASCLRAAAHSKQQRFLSASSSTPLRLDEVIFSAVQHNSTNVCDARRKIPHTLVIIVKINGYPCRALIDTGSMGDFISTMIVDQLGLKNIVLAIPLPLQMAVQGSRSKI